MRYFHLINLLQVVFWKLMILLLIVLIIYVILTGELITLGWTIVVDRIGAMDKHAKSHARTERLA